MREFEDLVQKGLDKVAHTIALAVGGKVGFDNATCEDVAQKVLLRIVQKLGTGKIVEVTKGLIEKMTHDAVIDELRSRARHPTYGADRLATSALEDEGQTLLCRTEEVREQLWGLQQRVRPHDWRVLQYCLEHGVELSSPDGETTIRQIFGLTAGALRSVRYRLQRAWYDLLRQNQEATSPWDLLCSIGYSMDPDAIDRLIGKLPAFWEVEGHLWVGRRFWEGLGELSNAEATRALSLYLPFEHYHCEQAVRLAYRSGRPEDIGRARWYYGDHLMWRSRHEERDYAERIVAEYAAAVESLLTVHWEDIIRDHVLRYVRDYLKDYNPPIVRRCGHLITTEFGIVFRKHRFRDGLSWIREHKGRP